MEKVEMTVENKIIDTKAKNQKLQYVWSAMALAGSIAGVVYASRKGKGFWGKVGFWVIGGMAVAVPTGLIINPRIIKNKATILKLQNELKVKQKDLLNEQPDVLKQEVKESPTK